VKGFLEDVVGDASILTDYRVEAAEQLRKLEGVPRIMSAIERPDLSPTVPVDREAERKEREAAAARKRKHLEEQALKDRAQLEREWAQMGYVPPAPPDDCS
jgi:hypothetical protein